MGKDRLILSGWCVRLSLRVKGHLEKGLSQVGSFDMWGEGCYLESLVNGLVSFSFCISTGDSLNIRSC